jgi:hypothetical protein
MSRRRDDAADAANLQVVQTMLAWIPICAVLNYFGNTFGNTAHVWGLLVGWLIGQMFVARKRWRIPLALATVVVWALPLIFIQRPVWDRTLAHVPPFNRWYFNRISPHLRDVFEDPEKAPDVGLISTRHRQQ